MTHIYCLRVIHTVAGKSFPFHRVYLAPAGEHGVFKQLFRYAFILHVDDVLRKLLWSNALTNTPGMHIPFHRDDAAPVIPTVHSINKFTDGDWVMAVPLLPRYVKDNLPNYLAAARRGAYTKHRNSLAHSAVRDPYPSLAYLQTPEENIRPICVACPRFIEHQNGLCHLGETVCYQSLQLGTRNHDQEALDAPWPMEDWAEDTLIVGGVDVLPG